MQKERDPDQLEPEQTLQEEKVEECCEECGEECDSADRSKATDAVEVSAAWKELNNKYLRLHAEFENFRRRTARESLEQAERSEWRVLEKILVVVDNFDRAIESGPGEDLQALFKGMKLIHEQFQGIVKGFGLEPVGAVGDDFDPHYHDALMKQPSEEQPEGALLAIFEKGYLAKGHVLRHAKVIVSAGSENNTQDCPKE